MSYIVERRSNGTPEYLAAETTGQPKSRADARWTRDIGHAKPFRGKTEATAYACFYGGEVVEVS